jgi:peptidoglycan hydrolase-like protein with peptidoglycan-binding domain
MMRNKSLTAAVVFGGAIGLAAVPAWSQTQPGSSPAAPSGKSELPSSKQGSPQTLPPSAGESSKGAPGAAMSSQDIKQIQQALQAKGHNAGTSGVMDDKTRDAIRAFQKKEGLSVTGNVDAKTAQALGVSVGQSGSSTGGGSSKGGTSSGSGTGSATGSGSTTSPGSSGSTGGSSAK